MADTPSFRTGYLSVLLHASTPEHRIRSLVRQMVVDALAAAGEWPTRVKIISNQPANDGPMTRWFVEYETGPHGEVTDPPEPLRLMRPAVGRPELSHARRSLSEQMPILGWRVHFTRGQFQMPRSCRPLLARHHHIRDHIRDEGHHYPPSPDTHPQITPFPTVITAPKPTDVNTGIHPGQPYRPPMALRVKD